jgi:hypothetical protein
VTFVKCDSQKRVMDMDPRRVFASLRVCALLCCLFSLLVSDAVGQGIGLPETSFVDSSSSRQWMPAGSACQQACWSAASLHVGWMTSPNRIRVGYDGLVLPGGCISSVFVYRLGGIQVGGSVPVRLGEKYALRAYGAYLIADHSAASQELTWTDNPPGVREWNRSNTESYKVGGEMLYRMSDRMALVGGFRWDSLLTNFSDSNPNYLFTTPWLHAQTTVTAYEPYLGIRVQQSPLPGGLTLQVVGFPAMFATIQHLNVCNNAGVPFAHTGSQNTNRGYFLEASAEWSLGVCQGVAAMGFVDCNFYYGQCDMIIQRHEGGANANTTTGQVTWAHRISSLVVGGKMEVAWNLPF